MAAEPILITSVSKQFVVRGRPQQSLIAAGARGDVAYLDPATLAVACERVQQAVAKELGWVDRPRGVIYVDIRPVRRDREEPEIIPFRTETGWAYRIDVPDEIARRPLLEILVETLLLQFADRGATNESVALPPWLVEGLTAHLAEGRLAGLALQAHPLNQVAADPTLRAPKTVRHTDADQALRERVHASGALTVDQLNWPEFEHMSPQQEEAYRYSAQLFVRELLRLRGGPDALCATLALLPEHLNWQTAFLRGFESHFARLIDVEKWWSVTVSQWKSHDTTVHWSGPRAHEQLEEILYTPMEVRIGDEATTHVAPVALQTVLNEWEFPRQSELLQTKLNQLEMARRRCTPEMVAIMDGYHKVLANYLKTRIENRRFFTDRRARNAVREATAALNSLDQQRLQLAARAAKTTGADSQTPPAGQVATQAQAAVRPPVAWSEPRPGVVPVTPPEPR